jgi:multidrug resistance efflux pump
MVTTGDSNIPLLLHLQQKEVHFPYRNIVAWVTKMKKDKIYQYAIYVVLSITIGFSAFLITSDNVAPFTTQASMQKTVANIAPEVTGVVTQVNVENGETVKTGDVLFSIDSRSYELAVRQAQAELHQVQESNSAKWQELQAANQTLAQRKIEWQNAKTKLTRYQSLLSKGLITQQEFDDVQMNDSVAERVAQSAHADSLRIQAELATEDNNAAVELAKAKLEQAELDLSHAVVVAKIDGTVSNLQLQAGTYMNKGTVAMFLVNEANSWLKADFNEKGISHLMVGTSVLIAFDAMPGQLFEGQVINRDSAIYDASSQNSMLSDVTNDSRWIREQQKIRTRIQVDGVDSALISGSKASVIVKNGNGLIDAIGYSWIQLVAYFRYIY